MLPQSLVLVQYSSQYQPHPLMTSHAAPQVCSSMSYICYVLITTGSSGTVAGLGGLAGVLILLLIMSAVVHIAMAVVIKRYN